MNTQKVVSALVYRPSIIHLNLYSGQGAFHRGGKKGGRDIFFLSHHAPATGPKLAQKVGQFLQGWEFCLLPDSLWGKPARDTHSTQHTHARCILKYKSPPQKTRSPTHSSPRSRPATVAGDPTVSVPPPDSPGRQAWHANDYLALQETTVAAPRKGYEHSCWRMKNSCSVTIYLSTTPPPPPHPPPLSFSVSFWTMHRWHTSQCSTRVWGCFVSDLWENINVVCVLSEMDQTIEWKRGASLSGSTSTGFLIWHRLDVHSNRPLQKTWEGSWESTREEDMEVRERRRGGEIRMAKEAFYSREDYSCVGSCISFLTFQVTYTHVYICSDHWIWAELKVETRELRKLWNSLRYNC